MLCNRVSLVRGQAIACHRKHALSQGGKCQPHASINSQKAPTNFKQVVATFSSGAILGPLLDAQHSRYHVLQYEHPFQIELSALGYTFESCWWVPLLFGAAGVILGVGQPFLDNLFRHKVRGRAPEPSWQLSIVGIAIFAVQYWASGYLADQVSSLQLLIGLQASALLFWWAFDSTLQGFLLAALTSLCGPAIEVALINIGHQYHYSHPDFAGIPGWIGAVYFCGGPAVGNLGRVINLTLQADQHEE